MQFSENWLRSLVNTNLDRQALSHALTMAGLEVEDMQPVSSMFSHVVVAKIISVEKHPDADRLQVCKVDVGLAEPLQIVCGATNARAGLLAPCAMVGAQLPAINGSTGIAIKQAKVRGVESFGMMCSAKEIGLATEATGLLELPDDAPVGQNIREFFDLDDTLFTLKLTPNRADCLSILGIARDVVAMTGASLSFSQIKEVAATSQRSMAVLVNEPQACPAYFGRVVEGVNAQAKTPDWMKQRLERSGVRSISALVDITNYVLLELGQPMHAFDLDKLGNHVEVRFARAEEPLKLLNGTEVNLKSDDLVISDNNGAIALAGIMGGEPTSVTHTTTNIFLESAFFTPNVIAGKARRLGLSTDSSYRFERGVDFGNTHVAIERATTLVLEICGGKAGSVTQAVSILPTRNTVKLRYARLLSVLGIEIDKNTVGQLLTQLGFDFMQNAEGFVVQAPTYRFDIAIEEDLIEEIARLHGYDHIPAIAPVASLTMLALPEAHQHQKVLRDSLVALGYQEVVNYSFVDESWERDLIGNTQPIQLKNPIASNLSVMRTCLWGGLLDTLVYNLNRQQERAFLFEIGATYFVVDGNYLQDTRLSGLAYGSAMPEQWAEDETEVDFFDVKAHVESLLGTALQYEKSTHSALHPGQTAKILLDGKAIGWIGKLHPKWQQHYSLTKNIFLFELDLNAISQRKIPSYVEVSKFLPIRRDIAVVVDQDVSVNAILTRVKLAKIDAIQTVELFDLYQGKGIAEYKKSLALSVLMHDTQKTLTDIEADAAIANLLQLLQIEFSAVLRN